MSALKLEDVLARADILPALPQVVRHILDTLRDERANAELLAERIGSDPAVVARLLAAANASAYGLAGHVDSLRQAVLLLGIEKVRAITLATAIVDRYHSAPPFDAQRLWLHSLGVAVCAREIAIHAGLDAESAFTAGLLHDIGQLLLFAVEPAAYAETLGAKGRLDISTVDAEHSCLGLDHAAVGAALARHWSLPEAIVLAIGGHHAPEALPDHELADVVHVAEVLSHALDLGGAPDNLVPELSELACARLGIEWDEFAARFPEIDARFDCICLMLGL
ncbi:MAG: HDOD domain-containing protein [Sterolibacteriaceae bacterium MAG5]|nr:HDOD domain-containing protein [Candidatus Nitricoxidireducens bremensis]